MLPFLEVTHLPSSSSFYSAILQPLGLRYLSAEPSSESDSVIPIITYGTTSPPTPVFQLRQVAPDSIRLSRILLSAPSPAAVAEFHSFALRAHPDLIKPTADGARSRATETRAKIPDFDGNTMEVAYLPPSDYPSRYGGSTVRKTQSTKSEASRILDWNYGVATSGPSHVAPASAYSPAAARRPSTQYAKDEPYSTLRRSVTSSSSVYEPTASPRQNSSGLSTGTVVGTLLGVAAGAAGAALTYSMVKDSPMRGSHEEADPPHFTRRSTFPEPFSAEPRGRYVEVERNVAKVRYPGEYPPVVDRRPAPEYIARYSKAGAPRSREVDDIYDDDSRSRHSSRSYRPAHVRTRSEATTTRKPLLIAESEHRSFVGSKHSNTPPITRSVVHRSHTYDHGDRESYVSARSQRSANTIRGAPPPGPVVVAPSSSQVISHSRAGSRVTTTTIKVRGSSTSPRAPLGRAGSYASARNVPLPASVAGTGYDDWDDGGSIAPSDSISCVGSRRSGRAYH
jgi:hypothetical protein